MKKLIIIPMLLLFAVLAKAQSDNYKAFKVDIQVGYAIPSASSGDGGTKAGVTFTIHPHYRLSDDFALGLRLEGAGLGYENQGSDDAKIALLRSYCLTGEYYFTNDGFRPFIGAGAGFFTQSSISTDNDNNSFVPGGTKFGVFPELGFELGHLRVSADYNACGNNNNYLAFKIGAFFGGGKKKK